MTARRIILATVGLSALALVIAGIIAVGTGVSHPVWFIGLSAGCAVVAICGIALEETQHRRDRDRQ